MRAVSAGARWPAGDHLRPIADPACRFLNVALGLDLPIRELAGAGWRSRGIRRAGSSGNEQARWQPPKKQLRRSASWRPLGWKAPFPWPKACATAQAMPRVATTGHPIAAGNLALPGHRSTGHLSDQVQRDMDRRTAMACFLFFVVAVHRLSRNRHVFPWPPGGCQQRSRPLLDSPGSAHANDSLTYGVGRASDLSLCSLSPLRRGCCANGRLHGQVACCGSTPASPSRCQFSTRLRPAGPLRAAVSASEHEELRAPFGLATTPDPIGITSIAQFTFQSPNHGGDFHCFGKVR